MTERKRDEMDRVSGGHVSAQQLEQKGWEAAVCHSMDTGQDHRPSRVYLGHSSPLWAVTWTPLGLAVW